MVLGNVMGERRNNYDSILKSVLGLDPEEAQLYLLIVYSGKMTVSKIAQACDWTNEKAKSPFKYVDGEGHVYRNRRGYIRITSSPIRSIERV